MQKVISIMSSDNYLHKSTEVCICFYIIFIHITMHVYDVPYTASYSYVATLLESLSCNLNY